MVIRQNISGNSFDSVRRADIIALAETEKSLGERVKMLILLSHQPEN